MRIRIFNVEQTPMWAIPDTEIFLSSEQNDFLDVDYSTLTPYQKQILWSAIKMKTLEAEDDEEFQSDFRVVLREYLKKRKETESSQLREVFGIETNPVSQSIPVSSVEALGAVSKANELKKVLKNSVASLKRLLVDYSAVDLETLFKLEQLGKNRKTVLGFISELITKQAQKNACKIENNNAPSASEYEERQVFKGMNRRLLSNITDVVESEEELVAIKIKDD
jgi:hypothetical protein